MYSAFLSKRQKITMWLFADGAALGDASDRNLVGDGKANILSEFTCMQLVEGREHFLGKQC